MIYAHTSFLTMPAALERHPDLLRVLLLAEPDGMVAVSTLIRREVAELPLAAEVRRRVTRLLEDPRVLQVEVSALIVDVALSLTDGLGTARNTHLATALSLRPAVVAFVCDDSALSVAARSHGLRTWTPPV